MALEPELLQVLGELNDRIKKLEKQQVAYHTHNGIDSPLVSAQRLYGAKGFDSKARAFITSNQTLTVGAPRKITLDTETYDVRGEFDSTTNNRFVADQAGYYLIHGKINIAANAVGDVYQLQLRVNNTGVADQFMYADLTTSDRITLQMTDIRKLAKADYVELFIDSSGAGNYTAIGGTAKTFLVVHRIA